MPLNSALKQILLPAICSLAVGIAAFLAVANSTAAFFLLLPTYAVLTAAILLSGGMVLRIIVAAMAALTFLAIGVGTGQLLVGALAFAFANSVAIAAACLPLRRQERMPVNLLAAMAGTRDTAGSAPSSVCGLVGRKQLVERIDAVSRAGNGAIALLSVDVDNFKFVNATLGHGAGDEVLAIILDRLRGCVQPGDIVARLSGDEFAIILSDARWRSAVEAAAQSVLEAINAPITLSQQDLRIGASIGVASWQQNIDIGGEFLRRAGVALNAAKAAGGGCFKIFEAQMDIPLRRQQALDQDLRQALAEQTFEVHYQPVVHLATNEVVAFEALVRWRHATRGLVSPAEFIPVAEELGLIAAIGDVVLRQACRDAVRWPDDVKVSVNFSRAQFELPNAKNRLEAALAEAGLPACRLQLEITETTVMANPDRANVLLDELRALGMEIAMDDFGTGYSSLGCLRNSPFDRLKIDRAFIQDLTTSLEARAILTMIVKLANTLGMHTTAEGVETAEQFAIVKEEGCSAMQGFFFSPAIPAHEVLAFFQRRIAGTDSAA